MTWWQAILIGIVEGLTEFLPVSSTGHILLAQRLMGIPQDDASDALAVVIQAGAILAVIGLYRQRARQVTLGVIGKDPDGLRLALQLLLAFLPFAVMALLFYEQVKEAFSVWVSVAGWIVGGVVILVTVWLRRGVKPDAGRTIADLNWRLALLIGLVQIWSLWPGTSRALAAIIGALLVGMSLRAAVEFSFLLGVVTLLAAAGYDGLKHGDAIFATYGYVTPTLAFLCSGIAAAVSVKWMVRYLERYSMAIFGYYRIALGGTIAALVYFGWLQVVA